jgi:hypothetical protein
MGAHRMVGCRTSNSTWSGKASLFRETNSLLAQKNPCSRSPKNSSLTHQKESGILSPARPRRPDSRTCSCILPVDQGIAQGDGFVTGSPHRQPGDQSRDFAPFAGREARKSRGRLPLSEPGC